MNTISSTEIVRRLFEDVINSGNLAEVPAILPEEFSRPVLALHAAFPDLRYVLEELLADGDRVAVRWMWHGTHRKPFRGFAATGKRVHNSGIAIFKVAGGRI